jgi:hypothetical protein
MFRDSICGALVEAIPSEIIYLFPGCITVREVPSVEAAMKAGFGQRRLRVENGIPAILCGSRSKVIVGVVFCPI